MSWLLWLALASPVTAVDALNEIERQANVVRQHPDSSSMEAQSAARLANRIGDPFLSRSVGEMAKSAREMDRAPQTRQKAIEVSRRVRVLKDALPAEE